jgi:trans-2,3-dihydro-3-hydroxyanthranilate isomerase
MTRYDYTLLDVFTDRAFGGNQLAVFSDGRGLSGEQMQALANELNLAETTFVLPPENSASDFRVRIFTSVIEMPMAGHPTLGTAFTLAGLGLIKGENEAVTRFEENVGLIKVKVKFEQGRPVFCQMEQPLPKFGPIVEDAAAVARMLSLEPESLVPGLPQEVVSCGVPYLMVPLKSLADIERIQVVPGLLQNIQATSGQSSVYAFTMETRTGPAQLHSRMFWLEGGMLAEDAATGSASGPLGCYVAKYNLLGDSPTINFVNEQGFEMNRPSFLHVEIEQTRPGQIIAVRVGGQAYFMGGGYFDLAES